MLRLALERWADEDTTAATGNRELAAHAIARPPKPRMSWYLALADSHALQHVRALLGDAPRITPWRGRDRLQVHHFSALLLL